MTKTVNPIEDEPPAIAVIGMAARFPQAENIDEFWKNLEQGKNCITHFSDKDLRNAGVSDRLLINPSYVKARGILKGIDLFDASFFGLTPSEASLMDPQQRIFLELCWDALEVSGYSALQDRSVGIFAGMSDSTYLNHNLLNNNEITKTNSSYQISIATSNHFLATKVSYLLNLTGPSIVVNTACSTSLVAIIEACKSLLNHECDLALAGGIAIRVPQIKGYLYREGGIYSSDGTCRAFDQQSSGTVSSNGGGVVVLKRLHEAIQAGDTIDAVIRNFAVNNDGATKIGYSAPSILEQARCVAIALSSIGAESISYVETHGTGTKLGDPVEIAALTKAFRHYTTKKNYCAIGSVKTNIGHTDVASGVAGFIKTALALKNKIIPSSLYFNQANAEINFTDSPFFVNATTAVWESEYPRRAGVSAFGIGGTNAHLVLEEAPLQPQSPQKIAQKQFIIPFSAKTETALQQQQINLLNYLKNHEIDNEKLANIAYTLQVGRQSFAHRKAFICSETQELIAFLQSGNPQEIKDTTSELVEKWLREGKTDLFLANIGSGLRRIPLPTYPFERKSYWVEPSIKAKAQSVEPLVYQPYWEVTPLTNKRLSENKNWLIFSDKLGISKNIASHLLTLNKHIIEIKKGKSFRQVSPCVFEINPTIKNHYQALFDILAQENQLPDTILYCWGLANEKTFHNTLSIDDIGDNDFVTLSYFTQVFFAHAINKQPDLFIFTNYLANVLPEDKIYPKQSLSLGMTAVIPQEFSTACSIIDIGSITNRKVEKKLIELLINECLGKPEISLIAYRHSLRFAQQFKRYELTTHVGKTHLKKEGIYLITGGLGKIGLELASYLAWHYNTHLILVTLAEPPDMHMIEQQQHQQGLSSNSSLNQLVTIKKHAASLSILQADVSDLNQMSNVFKYIKEHYGNLNGLFHLAAVIDNSTRVLIKDLTIEQIQNQWLAKIGGVNVLAQLVNEEEIDFCLLFSSISSVIGGVGLSAYAAANNYLNYFVESRILALNGVRKWFSMSWDAWKHSLSSVKRNQYDENLKAITFQQGMDIIERYFNGMDTSNLFISFNKLHNYLNQLTTHHTKSNTPPVSESCSQATESNFVRKTIEQLFKDCLGEQIINPTIGFYDLGGDSLRALTLLELIEEKFSIRLSLTNFLENQSIDKLVAIINKQKLTDSFVVNLSPEVITSKSLFFIHPIGGTAFCYLDLVNLLPKLSCYAFQDPGLNSNEFNFKSLEEMASYYLQEIKRRQPKGPYLLGGYSFGATLAFEIAKQLLISKEKIENIFIIDGWGVFSPELHDKDRFDLAMKRTLADIKVQVPNVLKSKNLLLEFLWKRMQLLLNYKPSSISLDITLFKAKEILPEYQSIDSNDNHWSSLTTKSVKTYSIPGNHSNLLQSSGAKEIGRVINELLVDFC